MPLKVQNNASRFSLASLVLFDGLIENVSRSFGGVNPALCRIPGRVAVGKELPDEGFVFRESDCEVIELKHFAFFPTSKFVERVRNLREVTRLFKTFVPFLFPCEINQKPTRFLRSVFQVFNNPTWLITNNCNSGGVHNLKLSLTFFANKNVRTRKNSKKVYTDFSTASFAVGGL